MILLSIIVPIFNTQEELLKRCLLSLMSIGISEYEVILVDDGSDVYVEKICAEYITRDNRFRYIKKNNGGVSSARNYGIEQALGSYIMFVDSDDVLIKDSIEIKDFSSQADLIFFNKTLYKGEGQRIRKEIDRQSGYVTISDIFEAMIKLNRFHGPMARLYKSSILKETGLTFDVNLMQGEDAVFNIDFLKECKSVYYIDKSVYGYYMTPATLRGRWQKEPYKMLANIQYLYIYKSDLLNLYNNTEKRKNLLYRLNSNTEYLLLQSCLDMMQVHVFNQDMQEKCIEISKDLSGNCKLDFKARVSSIIIENKVWLCLRIIGIAREVYLSKLKKTWK